MAVVQLSDVIVPEYFAEYMATNPFVREEPGFSLEIFAA